MITGKCYHLFQLLIFALFTTTAANIETKGATSSSRDSNGDSSNSSIDGSKVIVKTLKIVANAQHHLQKADGNQELLRYSENNDMNNKQLLSSESGLVKTYTISDRQNLNITATISNSPSQVAVLISPLFTNKSELPFVTDLVPLTGKQIALLSADDYDEVHGSGINRSEKNKRTREGGSGYEDVVDVDDDDDDDELSSNKRNKIAHRRSSSNSNSLEYKVVINTSNPNMLAPIRTTYLLELLVGDAFPNSTSANNKSFRIPLLKLNIEFSNRLKLLKIPSNVIYPQINNYNYMHTTTSKSNNDIINSYTHHFILASEAYVNPQPLILHAFNDEVYVHNPIIVFIAFTITTVLPLLCLLYAWKSNNANISLLTSTGRGNSSTITSSCDYGSSMNSEASASSTISTSTTINSSISSNLSHAGTNLVVNLMFILCLLSVVFTIIVLYFGYFNLIQISKILVPLILTTAIIGNSALCNIRDIRGGKEGWDNLLSASSRDRSSSFSSSNCSDCNNNTTSISNNSVNNSRNNSRRGNSSGCNSFREKKKAK